MGKLGCLIIHGFSGTIDDIKPLSQFLNANGYITYCPLLNGHGGDKKQLANSNYKSWINSAQEGYDYLKSMCDKVIIIGFSMGGLIAVNLVTNNDIEALITLSSPIKFWDLKIISANIVNDIKKRCFDKTKEYIAWISRIPIISCINFLILLNKTKHLLKYINIPCLVIQGKNDDTSCWMSAEYIFANIASKKKEIKYYNDAPHIICNYKNSASVFKDIQNFIQMLEQPDILKINAV